MKKYFQPFELIERIEPFEPLKLQKPQKPQKPQKIIIYLPKLLSENPLFLNNAFLCV